MQQGAKQKSLYIRVNIPLLIKVNFSSPQNPEPQEKSEPNPKPEKILWK
jgi:hypothetical protein